MQDARAKIIRVFRSLLGLGAVLAGLLLVVAGVFWWNEISYVHPGPAFALGTLAAVVLVVAWTGNSLQAEYRRRSQEIDDLRAENIKLLQDTKERDEKLKAPARSTRIIGLELLVERWKEFNPAGRDDSAILYEQISIAQSIVQMAYKQFDQIGFIRVFRGTKIKSGAFLLKPGPGKPLVLKFDSWENIGKEKERYEQCVARRLGQTPGEPWIPPQRRGIIQGKEWGAIAYNLVGDNQDKLEGVQTFGEYYLKHGSHQITDALNKIFGAIKPCWGTEAAQADDCARSKRVTLYGEYDRLTRRFDEIQKGIREVGEKLSILILATISPDQGIVIIDSLQLRNPLNWVKDMFGARRLGGWAEEMRQASIVHGDFHTGNILLEEHDDSARVWLIDFPHAHVGPTVQDIARLEADIKVGLLPSDLLASLGLNALYQFEASLLPEPRNAAQPRFVDLDPSRGWLTAAGKPTAPETAAQLEKTWEAVKLLRNEARKYMKGDDARPYYLALLHATLPMLYYRDHSPWQKLYAFVSAALLCERLGN